MNCKCGFVFSEVANDYPKFSTDDGTQGVICPVCKTPYLDGEEVDWSE